MEPTSGIELRPHWKLRWGAIAILTIPTLVVVARLAHKAPHERRVLAAAGQSQKAPPAAQPSSPWRMQESGTTAGLRGIYSVDGKTAWASGTEGTVLRTLDGGAHWLKCAIPGGDKDGATLDFRGVQAWDASTAIVMASGPGDKSRLYETNDGCKSWKLLFRNPETPDGFFDSFFADWSNEGGTSAWVGSLLGDPVHGQFAVYDTLDSGATWTQRKSASLALGDASLAAFAASNSLFPASPDQSHNGHIFASGGKSGAILWVEKTWEAKAPAPTWRRIELPLAHGSDSSGIFSIASHTESVPFRNIISNRETLVAVGGDYTKPDESAGTAAWSNDGGVSWHAAEHPPHGYRSSVAYSPELELWIAVGTNGSDVSRDDGKSWTPLAGEAAAEATTDTGWNAISLPFVVGSKGRIARLAPGGAK